MNDGFDSLPIKYFVAEDFQTVLDRVEALGLGIYGIEPWLDGEYFGTSIYEDFTNDCKDPTWYRNAFQMYQEQYSATYYVPDKLLDPHTANL